MDSGVKETLEGKDKYKFSRLLYIIEAALEYFVSIGVGGVYLATITNHIGISDSVTGILSSFVSLGCGFQMIAIFLAHKQPVKRWVTILHIISQTMFALIYFVPLFNLTRTMKTVIFVIMLLSAHIIHNIVNSPKINWYMSLVDDKKRGRFTANKEIISLLGGMGFSYGMGFLMDSFKAANNLEGAFIVGGITLFVLMGLHSATLIFAKEKPVENVKKVSFKKEVKALTKDKTLFKVVLISVFWNIANYIITPFQSTYATKELALSLSFVSVIAMASSFCRVLCSKPLGKYADKFSFTKMLIVCYVIEAVAFGANAFTSPATGKVLYIVYQLLYAAGMAGINSAVINLIYDYVEVEHRTSALALKQTLAGTAGFLTTLAVSPLVSYIQGNGNQIFGMKIYAQQFLSAIACLLTVALVFYIVFVVQRLQKKKTQESLPATASSEASDGLAQEAAQEVAREVAQTAEQAGSEQNSEEA